MDHNTFPLVTIAIPTYNRANGYLRNAIECALKQTYQNIEVVVSDNCSSDNTGEIVKGYADPRIRYFRQEANIGANNNFNYCLDKAHGSYFLLFHDDDLIDSDFVETCIKSLVNRADVGIIQTGTRVIDVGGNVLREIPNRVGDASIEDFFRGWFAGRTALYLCSTLFNTGRLREIGGFRSKHNLFQDVFAEVQLAALYGRVGIRDVKASFRKHTGEMTFAAKVLDWCEDSICLLDVMCALLPEKEKTLRSEGLPFFAKLNYNRAKAVKNPLRRIAAYIMVFKQFRYRYLPSKKHYLSPFVEMLSETFLYSWLRSVKRKIKRAPANG